MDQLRLERDQMFKSTCCPCKGPEFSSCHPHWDCYDNLLTSGEFSVLLDPHWAPIGTKEVPELCVGCNGDLENR